MTLESTRKQLISFYHRYSTYVNQSISIIGVALFMLMCLIVGLQMLTRWVLSDYGIHLVWTESLSRFLLIIVTFFGAAVANRDNEHVKISLLLLKPPKIVSRVLAAIGNSLILGFIFVLIVGGFRSYDYNIGSQFHILPEVSPFTREWLSLVVILSGIMIGIYILRDLYRLVTDENSVYEIYAR